MKIQVPNIVFFTWHDAGDWFGCYGYNTVHTPNVDRLARTGVRFTNNFSACAICSPSRAAIMTGRFCQENGVMSLTNGVFNDRLYPHIPHLAKRLKRRGFRTALFGVQHETAHEHISSVMDFDERYATDPWPNSDLLAHYAARWLRAQKNPDRPFYMQVGSYDAHLGRCYNNQPARPDEPYSPVTDTEKGLFIPPYLEDNPAGRATVATLQGLLRRGDRLMGAILDALDATGQAANTIVVMCVDHGVGLSRAKTTCYDPGHRTAWMMRWPGHLPAGHQVNSLSTHVDVLPTLRELLGWDPIDELDGLSLAAQARGQSNAEVRDAVFGHMVENFRMIRTRRHKLIRNFRPFSHHQFKGDCATQHKGFPTPQRPLPTPHQTPDSTFPALELYDLALDPHETNNLAGHPHSASILAELDARLWDFLLTHDDFIVHDPVRTPWQQATRQDLVAYCTAAGRQPPFAEGPFGNPLDAASQRGSVADQCDLLHA